MLSFAHIRLHIIDKLQKGLSPALTYHNVAHTLDVLKQAVDIAKNEGIADENDLLLLKISALYHDVGFLKIYAGHEEISCQVASAELCDFGTKKVPTASKAKGIVCPLATRCPLNLSCGFKG